MAWEVLSFLNHPSGMHSADVAVSIPDGAVVELINADLNKEPGALCKRPGTARFRPSLGSTGLRGAFEFFHGGVSDIYVSWNGGLYKVTDTAYTSKLIDLSINRADAQVYRKTLYIVDGVNGLTQVTAAGVASRVTPKTPGVGDPLNVLTDPSAAIQTCRFIDLHWWNSVILTGSLDSPNGFWISSLEDPSYFPASTAGAYYNSFYQIPDDNDEITWSLKYGKSHIFFRKWDVWGLFGDSPASYTLQPINSEVGTSAGRTVAIMEGYIVYFGSDMQVHTLIPSDSGVQGDMRATVISTQIQDRLRGISDPTQVFGVYRNGIYYLSSPVDGVVFKYRPFPGNPMQGAWAVDTYAGPSIGQFLARRDTTLPLLACSANTGILWEFDPGLYSDDGAAFTFKVSSKLYNLDRARLGRLFILFKGTETKVNLSYAIIVDGVTTKYGNIALDADPDTQFGSWLLGSSYLGNYPNAMYKQVRLRGQAHTVQVIINHASTDEDITVYGWLLQVKPKKMKASGKGVTVSA